MRDPLTPLNLQATQRRLRDLPMRHSPMSKSEEQHPSPEFSNASQSRVVKGSPPVDPPQRRLEYDAGS